jgi:hypothetical protein
VGEGTGTKGGGRGAQIAEGARVHGLGGARDRAIRRGCRPAFVFLRPPRRQGGIAGPRRPRVDSRRELAFHPVETEGIVVTGANRLSCLFLEDRLPW